MRISKIYIETINNGKLAPEMQDVYDVMVERDIQVELFIHKHIQRNRLEINRDTPVIGFVDSMLSAFRLLKIGVPATNDYPTALKPHYHRRIWESDVRKLKDQMYADHLPVFAKPKNRKKRFTGAVLSSIDDLYLLYGLSNQMELYCSEVVSWISEYRVYVIESKIVGLHHYEGDLTVKLDDSSIKKMLRLLDESTRQPQVTRLI